MIIKGIVTGVVRDAETGEFKRSFTVENDVTNYQLQQMASFPRSTNVPLFGPNIFVAGETDTIKSTRASYVYEVFEAGFVESGVSSPTYHYPSSDTGSPVLLTPPYIQFQQRFNPPAADRTITIIGLTQDTPTSTNIQTYKRSLSHAWVTLSPFCIQTTTETLDVFYRIQFLYEYDLPIGDQPSPTAIGMEKYSAYRAAIRFAQNNSSYFMRGHHVWSGSNLNNRNTRYSYIQDSHDYITQSETPDPFTDAAYTSIIKSELRMDYDISQFIGKLIGSVAWGGYGTTNTFVTDIRNMISLANGDSPIQNAFGHSALATKPFFDSTQTQSGTGTLSIDGSSWTNPDWPKMYRIDIVSGGATGTATYRLKVRNHFGFHQNFYRDQERAMIQMRSQHSIPNYEGFNIGYDVPAWFNYTFSSQWGAVAVNPNEICVINLATQTGKRTHVDAQPNFTATKIGVIAIEQATGDIWVPCRETGLYKIVDPENTRVVTKITFPAPTGSPEQPLDRCIGVAVTPVPGAGSPAGKRVWALFSDASGDRITNPDVGLYYSDNDGSTWTQDATWNPTVGTYWTNGWTNGNVNRIPYIYSDPTHGDGRLLMGYSRYNSSQQSTYDYIYGIWHDGISGTSNGPQLTILRHVLSSYNFNRIAAEDPRTMANQWSASPNQGRWGGRYCNSSSFFPQYIFYGSTSFTRSSTSLRNAHNTGFAVDDVGDDSLVYIRDDGNPGYLGVYKTNNTTVEDQITNASSSTHDFSNVAGTFKGTVLYLGEGITLGYQQANGAYMGIATLSTENAPLGHQLASLNAWTDYGWNGASWEVGHAGNKTTHAPAEVLVDGVTIAFADAVASPGGAGNWIATDYYTFGVVDGVWLDGSTEVHHKTALYMKPAVEGQTEIESATLPAITKSIDYLGGIPSYTYQNISSNFINDQNGRRGYYSGSYILNSFNGYAQSNEFLPAVNIGNNSKNDIHAGMYFYHYSTGSVQVQLVLGLSSQTRINNVASYVGQRENSPEYAWRIDPPTNNTAGYADISVVHSGVEQAKIVNFHVQENGLGESTYYRIIIKKDGHIRYSYFHASHGERILYDTSAGSPEPAPPITLPHENYYMDYATSGQSSFGGFENLWLYGPTAPDYFLELGTVGSSSGYWNTDFYSIDYNHGFDITIAGVATPTSVGNNNETTVLSSGQYSIFPNTGVIRYSSADVGKAVSVTYTELTNE